MDDNFVVFILTHGRPDNVKTFRTLKSQGYTGKIYIVIDNEDDRADEYIEEFGDQIIMFDKLAISETFDTADNFTDRRTIVYARNACFDIAKELGVEYFLQLDDDYTLFYYKFNSKFEYKVEKCLNLDKLFNTVLEYYKKTPAITTIAFAQGGDFLGGSDGYNAASIWLKRKAMNTFFCSTNRPFTFVGRINEDVNTYTSEGNRGVLFLTLFSAGINQVITQTSSGGMSEAYENEGTYIKSFYSVMYCPSSVKVSIMHSANSRLHHRISWKNTVPCIMNQSVKKKIKA